MKLNVDAGHGTPAAGIEALLYREGDQPLGRGETNADGRIMDGLISDADYRPGIYRLCFRTGKQFDRMGQESFYPEVVVTFVVAEGQAHYRVPLLLARFGYSTYRGS